MYSKGALRPGIYEQLVSLQRQIALEHIAENNLIADIRGLSDIEAAERISAVIERITKQTLRALPEVGRANLATELANSLIKLIVKEAPAGSVEGEELVVPPQVLKAILEINPDGSQKAIQLPLTSLLDTTLLTNSRGEPRLTNELQREVPSADSIDAIVAFIRWSGVRPLIESFRQHIAAGKRIRILTTTYTNSTELRALEALKSIGVEIKVSYDQSSTRLHAKAWIFDRIAGFPTAYIGSSNLSHSAMGSGMEWNLRVSGAKNEDVLQKMKGVFQSYWSSGDFEDFDPEVFAVRTQSSGNTAPTPLSAIAVRLLPFQERLLEQIWAARKSGRSRNLLVSATGTGKTVMAAVDFKSQFDENPNLRLLFVAHRREILDQSLATFRQVLGDGSFGEKWVGGDRPSKFDHVFASIQSLNSTGIDFIQPEHFDVVVVDEFHHAGAATYALLLQHLRPNQLLGLTATPERADGLDILHYFGGSITAELRLWDAIEQQYLVPFHYFGVHDNTDLSDIPWRKGTGYDVDALSNLYTGTDRWASLVFKETVRLTGGTVDLKAIGFCVSIHHAEFMARKFNEFGVPSAVVVGTSSSEDRAIALKNLRTGKFKIVFSVDVLNEGVDLPEVNTILMFRPTDSSTVFLQQLGRGLRKSKDKTSCTVLDFVGIQSDAFRFENKLSVLSGFHKRDLTEQVEEGFPFLPAGCEIELDPVARKIILDNLKFSLPQTFAKRAAELKQLGDMSLAAYLRTTGNDLSTVYAGGHSWTELRARAGFLGTQPDSEDEGFILRAISRLLHVDDHERIDAYQEFCQTDFSLSGRGESTRRQFRMLAASLGLLHAGVTLEAVNTKFQQHPRARGELLELLQVLRGTVSHLHLPLSEMPMVPLSVHATYTRKEIQAAFGDGGESNLPAFREGVKWLEGPATDIFLVTLDKSSGRFSPTTRYRDFAVSQELFHWESQSTTSDTSPTGRRYIQQRSAGTNIALFVRGDDRENAFRFLGLADYESHTGSRPIEFVLRLRHRLPGDWYSEFALAVA